MRQYVEIVKADVGQWLFRAFGRAWPVSSFMGRIMPQDVGKRVYLVQAGGSTSILQVENDKQLAHRKGI